MISKIVDHVRFLLVIIIVIFSSQLSAQVELISSGTGAAYTLSYPANTNGYVNGMSITFKSHIANTGAATINVNSHGPVSIVNTANVALSAGDIKLDQIVTIVYDGTNFQMITTSGNILAGTPVSGSGTIDFVPKWSGSFSLSNSLIFDNGTNIGIGTSSPLHKLEINSAASVGDTTGVTHVYSNNSSQSNAFAAIGNNTGTPSATTLYSRAYLAGYGNIRNAGLGDYGVWGEGATWGIVATNTSNTNYIALAGNPNTLRIVDGNEGTSKVLTSDASGNASWQTLPGGINTWTRTPPRLYLNNISDSVGIGISFPIAKLHVRKTGGAGDGAAFYHSGSGDAINGYNTGTGGAGYFQISNVANASDAIYSTTNGSGATIFGNATGIGRAGEFQINNAANANIALAAYSNGTGRAGYFEVTSASNPSDALSVYHNGSGDAINGYNYGTGRAGYFQIVNSFSAGNSLYAVSNGTGNVAVFESTHATSPTAVLAVKGGHILSTGTAPAVTLSTANGLTGAGIIGATSTDVKGTITTAGTNGGALNSVITLTFNKPYATSPKVVITAANANAQATTYYVTSTTTTFLLNFKGGGAAPSFNYIVIE
ncbi:MAG: hypothetical protein HYU69_04260 [Bacteroidetes bacterium]|nr:hypothetical protein [Bacteroidota bacterium]